MEAHATQPELNIALALMLEARRDACPPEYVPEVTRDPDVAHKHYSLVGARQLRDELSELFESAPDVESMHVGRLSRIDRSPMGRQRSRVELNDPDIFPVVHPLETRVANRSSRLIARFLNIPENR